MVRAEIFIERQIATIMLALGFSQTLKLLILITGCSLQTVNPLPTKSYFHNLDIVNSHGNWSTSELCERETNCYWLSSIIIDRWNLLRSNTCPNLQCESSCIGKWIQLKKPRLCKRKTARSLRHPESSFEKNTRVSLFQFAKRSSIPSSSTPNNFSSFPSILIQEVTTFPCYH